MVRKNWIYPVFLFLVVGMADAVYLSYHHYLVNLAHPESASFCTVNSVVDCDQVATSRFSTLFGIPVAILGFFSYSFLAIFLLFGLVKRSDSLKEICSLVTLFSILMFLFAMYEATVSVFLLGKICLMCSILYGCGIGLLISSRRSIALPFRQVLGIAGGSLIGLFSRSERKSCLGSILFAFGISLLLSVATDYGLQRHFAKKEAADEVSARSALRQGMEFMNRNREKEGVVSLPGGLQYKVIKKGEGLRPFPDGSITVHYSGRLVDGTEFHNSRKGGSPATFALKSVMPGWRQGIGSMRVGGKRLLFVPPHLAYGSRSLGKSIPPNSTLIFEIELLGIVE